MKRLVLDASITVGWLLADEHEFGADLLEPVLEQQAALVPAIWHIELRSALLNAERRKRITRDEFEDILQHLPLIPVSTNSSPHLDIALTLARKHRLSIYDAIYLELALRFDARLATRDKSLTQAALAERCLFSNSVQ